MVHRATVFDYVNVVLMVLLALVTLYPLLYTVFVSLSDARAIVDGSVMWRPSGINIGAYSLLFRDQQIPRAFANSILYAVLSTVMYLIANSIIAYPLIYNRFWLNKPLSIYYIVTMFVGGGMIPTYLLYRAIGLIDNILVMVIPGAVSVYTIMIFMTNFKSLGTALFEAAHMDGAHDFYILFRIIGPLSAPILATFGLFQLVGKWNDFFTPLLYFSRRELYPLTLVLRRLLIQSQVEEFRRILEENLNKPMWKGKQINVESIKAASVIVTILPILFIYPFLQRYFAKGIMIGSLKG